MSASTGGDIETIKQLKARYFRLMDTKDWDGLAEVFTADVVIDVSEEGSPISHVVADYMPFLRENIEHVATEAEVPLRPVEKKGAPWWSAFWAAWRSR